ncbi:GNAT family N-acetyltransferase [Croceitalea rosinachiae]|uniref:GNAT family N-acetyltransferase n=1 Tax=Croceitalea rosinachiae TaxID=3075596 RepID=A0ABU3ACE6_9FLAO|nr:GNAT family N-acetyltransferase [Croceitalea sp. F388]MDT0607852.1 GNAT family N-acetyltransferase [Croceitalea sp. F388]
MIIDNPFSSKIFISYWSKHFLSNKKTYLFQFVKNLTFYKSKLPGLYINTGKNLTKGISYELSPLNEENKKGKTLLIYDVINYNGERKSLKNKGIGLHTVGQYPGFLIDLEAYSNLNEFMTNTFKKSSRYKLKKYKNKLETCFDINYKLFNGEILQKEYDFIFENFRKLLVKRFEDKEITNNNLNRSEWDFYREVAYSMIIEKKAGLFVIYNGAQPIGVTLVYFSEKIVFDAITVFDIDYAKFHLGSITIMKLIEWSISNNFKIFDFSKGYFDYKKRWATKKYDFEYHIIYDRESIKAQILAFGIKSFFEFKQLLREKNINQQFHKLTFLLRKKNTSVKPRLSYNFTETEKEYSDEELIKINLDTKKNHFLKNPVFNFLYLNNEKSNSLQAFKIIGKNDYYLFKGENKIIELNIKLPR